MTAAAGARPARGPGRPAAKLPRIDRRAAPAERALSGGPWRRRRVPAAPWTIPGARQPRPRSSASTVEGASI